MKKFLAIVLALATVLGLCACGGGGNEGGGGKDASGNVTIKIGVNTNPNVISYDDNALTKWLEAQTGFDLEVVQYSGGTDVATQISTTVAAGKDLPDILWDINLSDAVVSSYGIEGYFLDLAPYFEDKEGASKVFWDRMNSELTEEQRKKVMDKITNPDTQGIYSLPTIKTSLVDNIAFMPYINTTWLDKLGLSAPTTKEELYDVLVAFRDKDPNGNGKKDEIPLFGSQKVGNGAHAIEWIINMFLYFDEDHPFYDYDGDGQLDYVYAQEEYREALKYVNKLYEEKLLTTMIYTVTQAEMRTITTPASGTTICGIFCGHLTTMIANGSELMYEYAPLAPIGYVNDESCSVNQECYITETAEKNGIADECFELMMQLYTWEGSRRVRYGEKGVNWDDPTPGAKSDYGVDADYLLIDDPFTKQTTAMWGQIAGTLSVYDEGESAELQTANGQWAVDKSKLMAEQRRLLDEKLAEEGHPKSTPTLYPTVEEDEAIDPVRTNVSNYKTSAVKDFVCGTNGMDIEDDSDWKAYLAELENLGLAKYEEYANTVYTRQMAE